jgi:phage baseplate assembly protein W
MPTLSQIKSPVWTYSIVGSGTIAEGIAAIRQCIDIIIRTTKGTDPLRPLFGSDVYKYQDAPVNIAIPNIKKAILEAIEIWETRVSISRIVHRVDKTNTGHLYFDIHYKLKDQNLTDALTVDIGNGSFTTEVTKNPLILIGYFPPNPSNFQLQVSLVLDDEIMLPLPPVDGFADGFEMYQWIKENWLNYGTWYLNADSIVGYMKPVYETGSLTITVLTKNRFQGGIPSLPISYSYHVAITVDGTLYESTENLFTPGQVRQWAEDNLGYLGFWQVVTNPGAFNDDYSDDFEIFLQLLVIYTSQATLVVIEVTTVPV